MPHLKEAFKISLSKKFEAIIRLLRIKPFYFNIFMKKLHLITLLLVTLCTLSLTSCDDDDEENVSPNEALLTNGEWTGEGIYARPYPFLPLTNLAEFLRTVGEDELADELDITTTTFDFEPDGTFSATRDGDTETGTWEFTDNEQRIIISGDDLVLTGANNEDATFTILLLSPTQFNLEVDVTEMGYDPSDFQDINRFEIRMVKP